MEQEAELLGKPRTTGRRDRVRRHRGWVSEGRKHTVEIVLPEVFGLELVALNAGNNCLLPIYRFTINLYLEKELKQPQS